MLPGLFFGFWRIVEIITLIPIVGMLSWFVDGFTKANQLTPTYILVLFIVSVLAACWAVATLFMYHRARGAGAFVAFVDLLFVGALIAAVYELRGITRESCTSFGTKNSSLYFSLGPFGAVGVSANNHLAIHLNKTCSMLKACFALGIMNIIFFSFTTFLALWVGHHNRDKYQERRVSRQTSYRSSSRGHTSPRRSHHSTRHSSRTRHAYV
ncbi:hypothetical protein EJ06DRAFT_316051 [Trichodelitschia bisporula]|uniref:MARVEL domain-containing protein n=1 Tax=Trichodelitschia bisporula TaxID=703511 RepID=A0A6G1I4C3_9PEZI|nr:hypothetical protein EJ06DRAFT_316051 [Trichodelitschia bisporula]